VTEQRVRRRIQISGLNSTQTRGFRVRVLQLWRVEDKRTMYTACTSEKTAWKCL